MRGWGAVAGEALGPLPLPLPLPAALQEGIPRQCPPNEAEVLEMRALFWEAMHRGTVTLPT